MLFNFVCSSWESLSIARRAPSVRTRFDESLDTRFVHPCQDCALDSGWRVSRTCVSHGLLRQSSASPESCILVQGSPEGFGICRLCLNLLFRLVVVSCFLFYFGLALLLLFAPRAPVCLCVRLCIEVPKAAEGTFSFKIAHAFLNRTIVSCLIPIAFDDFLRGAVPSSAANQPSKISPKHKF